MKGGININNKLSKEEKEFKQEERRIKKYNKTHKTVDGVIFKYCNQHKNFFPKENEWLPMTDEYFYKNKSSGLDGYHTWCKQCAVIKSEKWRKDPKNKESILKSERKRNALPRNVIKVREA